MYRDIVAAIMLLVAAGFVLFCIYLYVVRRKYNHIPSPKGATYVSRITSFIFGHLGEIQRERSKHGGEYPPDDLYLRWASECGSLFAIFVLWHVYIIAFDPSDLEAVFMAPAYRKSKITDMIFGQICGQRFLGKGLFTIRDYETWKPRRKMYDPAFNRGYLKSLTPMFGECVDKFLDKLKPLADGRTQVPMKKHIHNAALDVISKVAFASDFRVECRHGKPLDSHNDGTGIESLVATTFTGVMKQLNYPFFQYLHPFEAKGYRKAVRALRTIGKECIVKRIKSLDSGEKVPNDILTHILKVASTNESADIETLVDDFVTFYVAGEASLSVCFCVFHVFRIFNIQYPEVLVRLLAEIDEVLGSRSSVTAEDLEKLRYTEQVIEETLRLHGPVGVTTRETPAEEVILSGYRVPGRTQLAAFTAAACRMPQHFDDPDMFKPARFDPENKRPSPFVYFPFGVGHRACIGRHFAMMEAKLVLSRLLQTFHVALPSDYKICVVEHTTRQPPDDIMCTLQPRK
eukprot:Em0004g514a